MENKIFVSYIAPFIIVISPFLGAFTLLYFFQHPKTEALIFTDMISFKNDEEKEYITFEVLNFGNEEAKNVKVFCYTSSESPADFEDVVYYFVIDLGNIAPHSVYWKSVEHSRSERSFYAKCFSYSCDNCRILEKHIKESKRFYELAEKLLQI